MTRYRYGFLDLNLFPKERRAKVFYRGNMGAGLDKVQECLLRLGERLAADPNTADRGKLILDHVHAGTPVEENGCPDYSYYALYTWERKKEKDMSKKLMKDEFLHFRPFGRDGKVLPRGGATVYFKPAAEGVEATLGVSVCSLKDNYCRKIGNAIAQGRASGGTFELVPTPVNRGERMQLACMIADQSLSRISARHGLAPQAVKIELVTRPRKKKA